MEITVKKTSVQKQIDGVGEVFNIKDAYVSISSNKVDNSNGSLYRKDTGEYAGSFNYSPGSSSVQVNDISDIAAASKDVADFITAVESTEAYNPTNI